MRSSLFACLMHCIRFLPQKFFLFCFISAFFFNPILTYAEPSSSNSRIPPYQRASPHWGVELAGSLNAFGNNALTPEQGTTPAYSAGIQLDYLPPFFQKLGAGLLGIGPSFSVYPISGVTENAFSLVAAGAQIRYQARFLREQPVVPTFAYSLEYLHYVFLNGMSGNILSKGPILGLWVLLNFLEPSAASAGYVDTGIARTYLILEARNLTGSDSNISFSGFSYFAGLRFEF